LKKYLSIIEDSPKYPVFFDANRTVLSLPPIINSEATKITMDTRNVFIELTGTDLNKLKVCLAIVAGQFSMHCKGDSQYTIEQVDIVYEGREELNETTPSLKEIDFEICLDSVNKTLGLTLDEGEVEACIKKMGLLFRKQGEAIHIGVPPTRTDIMQ